MTQNGPIELKGNLMQSCAWHHIQNQDVIIDTLNCIESTHIPIDNNPMNIIQVETKFKEVRYQAMLRRLYFE